MHVPTFAFVLAFAGPVLGQQIYDIVSAASIRYRVQVGLFAEFSLSAQWSTTWDRSKLFTYTNLSPNPINFGSPGAIGEADIVVTDTSTFQSIWGFGASLSTLPPPAARCHASLASHLVRHF